MSTPFQNRLVGTAIVAAVAIIFLPDLLDGKKEKYQQHFAEIPQPPELAQRPSLKTLPQERIAKLKPAPLSDEQALDQASDFEQPAIQSEDKNTQTNEVTQVTAAIKTAKISDAQSSAKKRSNSDNKVVKKNPLPPRAGDQQAWVIQLGSFRHQQNVDQLLKVLKANGYVAFTKPIKTRNGTLTKVFVGPEIVKSSLEKQLPKLKQLTKVNGKIARFSPAK